MKYLNYLSGSVIKKLTDADHKFITTIIADKIPDDNVTISNPWSGDSKEVDPLLGTLVNMIYDLSDNGLNDASCSRWGISPSGAVPKFDRARMLVLKIDKDVYYDFLD